VDQGVAVAGGEDPGAVAGGMQDHADGERQPAEQSRAARQAGDLADRQAVR
jgi:hypothetical protein